MTRSLSEAIKTAGGAVNLLHNSQATQQVVPSAVPAEYSNWESEQLAWRDSCGLLDLSHHMVTMTLDGPDVIPFLSRLGVNNFDKFPVNMAKQLVACNPDGFFIGQGILFRVSDRKVLLVGPHPIMDWVEYNHAATSNRIRLDREGTSLTRPGEPSYFRYQLQGPKAPDIMRDCLGSEPPELRFFQMGNIAIAGKNVTLLRHGMVGLPGFELFGDWNDRAVVTEALLKKGQKHGLKRTGAAAYFTTSVYSGYFPAAVPAIYTHPELAEYRDWLSDRSWEATVPLGGSYYSDNIEDYYLTPFALGYGRTVSLNHEFIGRSALENMVDSGDSSKKTKVTLVWNPDDVAGIFRSWFDEGEHAKMLQIPGGPNYSTLRYDTVLINGKRVGISGWSAMASAYRRLLSLAIVDTEAAEEGTEVSLLWGEEPNSDKIRVEPHKQVELRATVTSAPIVEFARTSYRQD